MFDCSVFLESNEGQAEFCAGAVRRINGWYKPSDSVDEEEAVPELRDRQYDDSGSEGEEEIKDHCSEWESDAESYTSSASDNNGESMPGQSARRLQDYWWHECMEEACTEDENSLQSLSEPNDLTNTKYRVLDDFFDKFGGESTKTQGKEAALMGNE